MGEKYYGKTRDDLIRGFVIDVCMIRGKLPAFALSWGNCKAHRVSAPSAWPIRTCVFGAAPLFVRSRISLVRLEALGG